MTDATAPDKTGSGSSFDIGAIFSYGLTKAIDAQYPSNTPATGADQRVSSEGTGTPTAAGTANATNPINQKNLITGGLILGGIVLTILVVKGLK